MNLPFRHKITFSLLVELLLDRLESFHALFLCRFCLFHEVTNFLTFCFLLVSLYPGEDFLLVLQHDLVAESLVTWHIELLLLVSMYARSILMEVSTFVNFGTVVVKVWWIEILPIFFKFLNDV
jgi:hypothetical protein